MAKVQILLIPMQDLDRDYKISGIFKCPTEGEMDSIARIVKEKMDGRTLGIILVSGEMGAGKTTFIRKFVNLFDPEQWVNSPTFNLIHTYHIPGGPVFYHFDLYRLKHPDDLMELGFEDIWGQKGISIIEWGDGFLEILGKVFLIIKIVVLDDMSREVILLEGK